MSLINSKLSQMTELSNLIDILRQVKRDVEQQFVGQVTFVQSDNSQEFPLLNYFKDEAL